MITRRRTAFIDLSSPQPMPKPIPHDPSLRVPSPRLLQTTPPAPPVEAGGAMLPAALVRAALHPFHFMLSQLWTAAVPLVDLLGLPTVAPFATDGPTPQGEVYAAPDRELTRLG